MLPLCTSPPPLVGCQSEMLAAPPNVYSAVFAIASAPSNMLIAPSFVRRFRWPGKIKTRLYGKFTQDLNWYLFELPHQTKTTLISIWGKENLASTRPVTVSRWISAKLQGSGGWYNRPRVEVACGGGKIDRQALAPSWRWRGWASRAACRSPRLGWCQWWHHSYTIPVKAVLFGLEFGVVIYYHIWWNCTI